MEKEHSQRKLDAQPSGSLWGYDPRESVSEDARRIYGHILPLVYEFVVGKLLPAYVPEPLRLDAQHDMEERVHEFISDARLAIGTDVPLPAVTEWIKTRIHRSRLEKRPPRDGRRRRRRLPLGPQLLAIYEYLHDTLKELLPRRGRAISQESLARIQKLYPELNWHEPSDWIDKTPAGTAHEILAERYEVTSSQVKRALEAARRESRS